MNYIVAYRPKGNDVTSMRTGWTFHHEVFKVDVPALRTAREYNESGYEAKVVEISMQTKPGYTGGESTTVETDVLVNLW